jgi:hypothetical protein
MKKIIYICFCVLLFACDSENANDCFQKSGSIVTEEIDLITFTKIKVNRDVELILKEGVTQQVIIETGENLLNDIELSVANNRLVITENNTCNFVRDYNVTKVYVTSPNITEIISSTQFKISSDGVLNYTDLDVLSEDFNDSSIIAVGEIDLNLNTQNLKVVGNNLTTFKFEGEAENLNITFAAGDGKLNAANLMANTVNVYHRGTNKIIVNPQLELTGTLLSTGNLISKNHPPIVNVEELYTGRLIFE